MAAESKPPPVTSWHDARLSRRRKKRHAVLRGEHIPTRQQIDKRRQERRRQEEQEQQHTQLAQLQLRQQMETLAVSASRAVGPVAPFIKRKAASQRKHTAVMQRFRREARKQTAQARKAACKVAELFLPRATHFLVIPLGHIPSVAKVVEEVQAAMRQQDATLASSFRHPAGAHISLCGLTLRDDREVNRVMRVLRHFSRSTGLASGWWDTIMIQPFDIDIKGLGTFGDGALFLKIGGGTGLVLLQQLKAALERHFAAHGWRLSSRPSGQYEFEFHITVANTFQPLTRDEFASGARCPSIPPAAYAAVADIKVEDVWVSRLKLAPSRWFASRSQQW